MILISLFETFLLKDITFNCNFRFQRELQFGFPFACMKYPVRSRMVPYSF